MAARQAGWLSACIAYNDNRPHKSRAQEIIDGGGTLPIVECTNGRHLIDALQELGHYQATEAGRSALSWQEIGAYATATGLISETWEMRIVREMSEAFLRGMAEGENPLSIPPAERSL